MSQTLSHPITHTPSHPRTRTDRVERAVPEKTGFPSPAADARPPDDPLELLIRRPAATFWHRITGDGLAASGIRDADLIAFDRGASIRPGRWVLAESPAGLATGLLIRRGDQWILGGGAGPGCPLDAETRLIAAAAALVRRYPV